MLLLTGTSPRIGAKPPRIVVRARPECSPRIVTSVVRLMPPETAATARSVEKLNEVGAPETLTALSNTTPPLSTAACTFCTSSGKTPVGYTTECAGWLAATAGAIISAVIRRRKRLEKAGRRDMRFSCAIRILGSQRGDRQPLGSGL